MLKNLGKFDKAIEMYDQTIKINPSDYIAYVHKGSICRSISRKCAI